MVHRHVFAREIYLPMEGGCQDPGKSSNKNENKECFYILIYENKNSLFLIAEEEINDSCDKF